MTKTNYQREANVLFYDLEVSGRLGWYYGVREVTPIREERAPTLLSVAWKWLGEKETHCLTLYDRQMADPLNDRMLVGELWSLLDKARIVVGHNSRSFDDKVASAFFLRHGMTPPSPYQEFDTLKTARKYFKFDDNRLDSLGKLLVGQGKTEVTYGDCWYNLMFGNNQEKKNASKLMSTYNKRDVEVLEKIYLKMLPWATNHPNMALAAGHDFLCSRCGNDSEFKIKAYRRTQTQVNAVQMQCKKCGAYVTRLLTPEEKEELMNKGSLKALYRNTV